MKSDLAEPPSPYYLSIWRHIWTAPNGSFAHPLYGSVHQVLSRFPAPGHGQQRQVLPHDNFLGTICNQDVIYRVHIKIRTCVMKGDCIESCFIEGVNGFYLLYFTSCLKCTVLVIFVLTRGCSQTTLTDFWAFLTRLPPGWQLYLIRFMI